jgi:hypothetical protein
LEKGAKKIFFGNLPAVYVAVIRAQGVPLAKDNWYNTNRFLRGEVAEWLKAAVSKTAVALVVTVGSNPTLSAIPQSPCQTRLLSAASAPLYAVFS